MKNNIYITKKINHSLKNYFSNIDNSVDSQSLLGSKICLIDSGIPSYRQDKDKDKINFSDSISESDSFGHANLCAGILCSDNKFIKGLAPEANFYWAKAVGDDGLVKSSSVLASILWAIAKKVDVIVVPIEIDISYHVFNEAIKKATKSNISVIVSTETRNSLDNENVFLCSSTDKKTEVIKNNIYIKNEGFISTHVDSKYYRVEGASFCACVLSALVLKARKKYLTNDFNVILNKISNSI